LPACVAKTGPRISDQPASHPSCNCSRNPYAGYAARIHEIAPIIFGKSALNSEHGINFHNLYNRQYRIWTLQNPTGVFR
jgi:hypothetical protein